MSDSNRRILAALAGLAALLTAYGLGVFTIALPQPEQERHATQSTKPDPGNGQSPTGSASGIRAPPAGDLSSTTQDQAYYNGEDLKAQREMAKWTRYMGQAAIVGVVLSMVGIWLIWRTWEATREAAESARETQKSFIQAERARIAVGLNRGFLTDSNELQAEINLFNLGRTAARLHRADYWVSETLRMPVGDDPRQSERIDKSLYIESETAIDVRLSDFPDGGYLVGRVIYGSAFAREHESYFGYRIAKHDSETHFVLSLTNVTTEEIPCDGDWPEDT